MLKAITIVILIQLATISSSVGNEPAPGQDLLPVFARAHAGLPLRAVAIGGSITQAGQGWVGPWLQEQFPHAPVSMANAGMSATGSLLGIFRLQRDVISAQPDLVLIEFAVNDGSLSDPDAIRYLESIVVRLKSLPHPPAIVFVETAARNGSNRARHQRVAAHYNLLDIDLQVAIDNHLKQSELEWSSLMTDSVHPGPDGHAFYASTIADKLTPFVEASATLDTTASQQPPPLPKPITTRPLLLDGRLVPISPAPGWHHAHSLPFWWNKFFNGVVQAKEPGTQLTIPVRGTTVGILYAMSTTYGKFAANIDGGAPHLVDTGTRGGYSLLILGTDLAPSEHLIRLAIARPPDNKSPATVALGYLLVAGDAGTTRELAPQGNIDIHAVATRQFTPIPAKAWEWCGSFGGTQKTHAVTADLQTAFAPETTPETTHWLPLQGTDPTVDFATLTGKSDRGICYARTSFTPAQAGQALLALRVDYFAKLWVNGKLIHTVDTTHGSPKNPILIATHLQAGPNTILVKVHSGSLGNQFSLEVQAPPKPAEQAD